MGGKHRRDKKVLLLLLVMVDSGGGDRDSDTKERTKGKELGVERRGITLKDIDNTGSRDKA